MTCLQSGTGRSADGYCRMPSRSCLKHRATGRISSRCSTGCFAIAPLERVGRAQASTTAAISHHHTPDEDPPARRQPASPYSACKISQDGSRELAQEVSGHASLTADTRPRMSPSPALGSVRRAFRWGHTHTASLLTLGVHDNRAARSHGLNRAASQDSALEGRQARRSVCPFLTPSSPWRVCLCLRGATACRVVGQDVRHANNMLGVEVWGPIIQGRL